MGMLPIPTSGRGPPSVQGAAAVRRAEEGVALHAPFPSGTGHLGSAPSGDAVRRARAHPHAGPVGGDALPLSHPQAAISPGHTPAWNASTKAFAICGRSHMICTGICIIG